MNDFDAHPPIAVHPGDPIFEAVRTGKDPMRAIREAEGAKGTKQQKVESPLEAMFLDLWHEHGNGIEPEREQPFAIGRIWKFDFCWKAQMVAVELEGCIRGKPGRHQRIDGMARDCEKYNAAVCLGWRLLRLTQKCLQEREGEIIDQVKQLLEGI
jgi:hypothetical protein